MTFSLIFAEIFGVAAGGIVVPGYVALQLNNVWMIVGTLFASFGAFLVVRLTSNFVFIYGRRRLVLSILLGFIFGYLLKNVLATPIYDLVDVRMQAIGYIIPGLIANWMERQGILRTLGSNHRFRCRASGSDDHRRRTDSCLGNSDLQCVPNERC